MAGHDYRVDDIYPEQIDEPPEEYIVTLSDAIRYEGAVMVKHFDAHVALATVDRSLRAHDHARKAEFQARDESFLAVQAIDHEVVFECTTPFKYVVIFGLLGDETRI